MYDNIGHPGPFPYPFSEVSRALELPFLAEVFAMRAPASVVEGLMQTCAALAEVMLAASRDADLAEQDVTECLRVLCGYHTSALAFFRHWQATDQAAPAPEPSTPLAPQKKGTTP